MFFSWEGDRRPGESNGSLPLVMIQKIICRLTACTPGSALGPTIGNEYGITLPVPPIHPAVMGTCIAGSQRRLSVACAVATETSIA